MFMGFASFFDLSFCAEQRSDILHLGVRKRAAVQSLL